MKRSAIVACLIGAACSSKVVKDGTDVHDAAGGAASGGTGGTGGSAGTTAGSGGLGGATGGVGGNTGGVGGNTGGAGGNTGGAGGVTAAGVGIACSSDVDCSGAGCAGCSCFAEFAGGYCSKTCQADADCPAGTACVTHDNGTSYCFRSCIDKAECNAMRPVSVEANCSTNVTFVSGAAGSIKVCVAPTAGGVGGSGGAGGSTGGAGGGGGTGGTGTSFDLTAFCLQYQETCGYGGTERFSSPSDCTMQVGDFTAARQDCVTAHLGYAANDPNVHCPHAMGLGFCE